MSDSSLGFTAWLTGLPCSGKSTLTTIVAEELRIRDVDYEVFDGDVVRTQLSRGLGFSKQDREENIRRIGYVCALLARHHVGVLVAAIAPYRGVREELKTLIPNFMEIYVRASLETCKRRDVKGLYAKALAGQIDNFTGVTDVYEPPMRPDLTLDTETYSERECATRIIWKLESLRYIRACAIATSLGPIACL